MLTSLPVGGFNPSEKYARQIGSFSEIGMNIKKIFETTTQTFFGGYPIIDGNRHSASSAVHPEWFDPRNGQKIYKSNGAVDW